MITTIRAARGGPEVIYTRLHVAADVVNPARVRRSDFVHSPQAKLRGQGSVRLITASLVAGCTCGDRAEAAEIFGDGVLVARWHAERIAAPDLSGSLAVQISPHLELEGIQTAQQSLVELFDHGRVAGEAAEIEVFHRADERLDLALHLWIVLGLPAKSIQLGDTLLNHLF